MGDWYGTWASRFAVNTSTTRRCVTANFTLQSLTSFVSLGCEQPAGGTCSAYAAAMVSKRSAIYDFSVAPSAPKSPYVVAAVLGTKSYKYHAVAIYAGVPVPDPAAGPGATRFLGSWFILARTPWAPRVVLRRLIRRLKKVGYKPDIDRFTEIAHPPSCVYQDGPGTFDIATTLNVSLAKV